jgi:EAL domain-containing protein (putative c-di-GMP-specific phosphodiesterase class I)/FixJ family two-component response regulator
MTRRPRLRKVLVLDDEPFVVRLLAHRLQYLGFDDVIPCEHGFDALNLLQSAPGKFDLIFCDLQMPRMDGVQFLRHLACAGYTGRVVLMSGEDQRTLQTAANAARAYKLDVAGVLHKPVSPEQLWKVLDGKPHRTVTTPHIDRKVYEPDELRRAIAGAELVNYYHPKVNLATSAVIGVETLVRWRHPQDGLVLPDQFITLAEENGLIDDLTRLVLVRALHHVRLWQDAGLYLNVSVNVSMDNLAALAFPDLILREADAAGVPVSSVMLEVTEGPLLKDRRAPLDVLARLRLKRIGLSIDDFGTAHSSLSQLHDIPFDELKIDRSLVRGASQDASLKSNIETLIGMAHHLGIKAVAEGVESQADWDYLRAAGCDLAQGYFIARPMPTDEVPGWIAAWNRCHRKSVECAA